METSNSLKIALFLTVALALVGWDLQSQLQRVQGDNAKLRENLYSQGVCAPVQITCECPDQECDPVPFDPEELEYLCAELEDMGYVADC